MTAATVMRGYGPLMTQGTIFPQDQHQLQHFKWKPPSAGAQWMDLKQEAEPDFFASLDLAMLKAEQQQLQQQQQQQQQQHQQQQQQQQLSSSGSAAEPKSVLDLPRSSPGGGSPSHSYISTLTSKDQQQQQQKQQSPGAGGDVIIPPKMEERVQQQQQTDDLSTLLCGMAELLPPGLGLGGLDPMASFPPIVDRLDFDAFDVVEQFGSRDEDMLADILDVDDFSPSGKFGEPQLLRRSSTFPEYHPQQHQQQQQRPASPPGMGAYAAPYEEFPNFFRLLDSHFTDTHAFPQASNGHIHPELAAAVLRQVIPNEEELVPVQPVQERLVAPPDISGNFMQGQPMYEENLGLRLVHRLLSCAEAIHLEDPVYGSSILPRLLDDADPYGDPMQRIAVYFGEALRECLETKFPPNFVRNRQLQQQKQQQQQGVVQQVVVQQQQQQQQQQLLQQQQQQQQLLQQQQQQQQQQLLQQQQQQQQHNIIHDQNMPGSSLDHDLAYQAMYQVLPFIKFSQFTANQAILDAVGKRDRIHIIDLDIKQGLQWPGLIQSLAVRQGGPPSLKLTGVGLDALVLAQTGRRLDEFAASLHVPFRFEAVVAKVDNLHSLLFNLEGEEGLAVNCPAVMHRLLADEQALDKVLRMVKSLQPSVVTLLEVEGNHNSDSFFDRFVAALHYYSAMFDSLEATLERDSTERLRIESLCLANEIRNILACDAGDRTSRHVRMDVWRGFLHRAAFTPRGLSNHALYQAKLLLGLYSSSSYKFTHDGYCAILGWHDTPVVSVSAWCYYSQDSERSAM